MPKKRFSEEQVAFALRQADSGTAVGEICRKLGVAEATFYRWKKPFAGMGVAKIRRLKQLEDENAKLKRLVADLTLDSQGPKATAMLQDVLRKNIEALCASNGCGAFSSCLRRQRAEGHSGERWQPIVASLQSTTRSLRALRMRLKELEAARVRFGYWRLQILLQREGWVANHKRIYRLYSEEGLSIRTKTPRRRRACRYRVGRPAIGGANQVRAMAQLSPRTGFRSGCSTDDPSGF